MDKNPHYFVAKKNGKYILNFSIDDKEYYCCELAGINDDHLVGTLVHYLNYGFRKVYHGARNYNPEVDKHIV